LPSLRRSWCGGAVSPTRCQILMLYFECLAWPRTI
jgi:hypothetical protein